MNSENLSPRASDFIGRVAKVVDIYRGDLIDLVPDACLPYEATWGYLQVDLSSPDAERLFAIIDDVHAHAGMKIRILRIRTGCTHGE